jgi:hypothetical protein
VENLKGALKWKMTTGQARRMGRSESGVSLFEALEDYNNKPLFSLSCPRHLFDDPALPPSNLRNGIVKNCKCSIRIFGIRRS